LIRSHSLLTDPRTAALLAQLPRTRRIIDVGPGIRPCPVFPSDEYVCIEPCEEYVEHLKDWRPPGSKHFRIAKTDASFLGFFEPGDTTVLMLDVIEHMDREVGLSILHMVESFEHAVVFTPLGWHRQGSENPDAWGLNGGYWQEHRSGWYPNDFEGWKVRSWDRWSAKVGAILAIR